MKITEMSSPDYMAGFCHVMAIAIKKLHPDWKIRGRGGWDEDDVYRVDHIYAVAPDGSAYDCRGRFDNENELLGPDETGGEDVEIVDMDLDLIRYLIRTKELKKFTQKDVDVATEKFKEISNTET